MADHDDDTLDKERISRREDPGQGAQEGSAGWGARQGTGGRDPMPEQPSAQVGDFRRSTPRERPKKETAALLQGDSNRSQERLRARPLALRLSPWERTVRITRRQCVPMQSGGGRRGPITQFTRASQRRLLRELYAVGGLWLHVTLTYPREFPRRGGEAKDHLQAFCRWLKGRGLGGVWVMEFQQDRGAPHFHILLNGPLDEADARGQWLRVIEEAGPAPWSCALKMEPIRDQYRVRSYVAKLPTKEVPCGFVGVGRFYGSFGTVTRIPTIDCTDAESLPLLTRALRTMDRKRRERRGWKRRRDSGRWSHSYGKWTNSEIAAIKRLIERANGQ